MAQRSFTFQIEAGRVFVKHRVPAIWAAMAGLTVILVGLLFLPGAVHLLAEARAGGGFFPGLKAVLELLLPVFGILIWIRISRGGEVLECDTAELHHARQRMGGGWNRRRFPVSDIQALKIERRAGSRTSSYLLLTFQCKGERVDTLMGIGPEDATRVLKACQSLGVDIDPAGRL